MRVLVTGSSGRLGGAIAELLRHRHQAVGLGRPAGVDGRGEPHAGRRRHRAKSRPVMRWGAGGSMAIGTTNGAPPPPETSAFAWEEVGGRVKPRNAKGLKPAASCWVRATTNDLSRIADRYPQLLASVKAGDVAFFGGHVLHRSKRNFTTDRFRRAFVGHYCNARSFTQWGADVAPDNPHAAAAVDPETKMTNGSHILARGGTHLPFAQPRFGTPCAALLRPEERRRQSEHAAAMMGDMDSGEMGTRPADPDVDHDDDE